MTLRMTWIVSRSQTTTYLVCCAETLAYLDLVCIYFYYKSRNGFITEEGKGLGFAVIEIRRDEQLY